MGKQLKFEDLQFISYLGVPLPTCRPARINKMREGRIVDFEGHGDCHNVTDIIDSYFLQQLPRHAWMNLDLYTELYLEWGELHPLLEYAPRSFGL